MTHSTDLCEKRQSQILEAALAVFIRTGMGHARMEDIAQEAGLSKGTLYLYFENKEALIVQLVKQIFGDYMRAIEQLTTGDGPVAARLCALAESLTTHSDDFTAAYPVMYEMFAWALREPAVHSIVEDYYRASLQVITALIQEGITRGEFRPIDPEEIALQIVALHEGVLQLQAFFGKTTDWRTLMVRAVAFILEALTPLPQSQE